MNNLEDKNQIDDDELQKYIIKRGEPEIYAFSTSNIQNAWKIGDTKRPVSERLGEWSDEYDDVKQEYSHSALLDNGFYFRDYAVHQHLKGLGKQNVPKKEFDDTHRHYSNEFFRNVCGQDIDEAILDIEKNCNEGTGEYQQYDSDDNAVSPKFHRDKELKLRKNQQEVVEKFKNVYKSHSNLLMYAVMRFGKTVTAMSCAKEMDAKSIIVVSGKADVEDEWRYAVQSFKPFEGYEFLTNENLKKNHQKGRSYLKTILKKGHKEGEEYFNKFVLFLTLQDLQGKEIKRHHEEIFSTEFDLMLIDETHFGARAEEYGKVLKEKYGFNDKQIQEELEDNNTYSKESEEKAKQIKAGIKIHLSGTPYKILLSNEFKTEDIIATVQYSDIYDAKLKWIETHKNEIIEYCEDEKKTANSLYEWDNDYYGFPQMLRFAFNPNESAQRRLKQLGESTSLAALFRTKSLTKEKGHDSFLDDNKSIILDLFKAIDGSKKDPNILDFLNNDIIKRERLFQHIVCVLPFKASCDALAKLLTNDKTSFKNLSDYHIVNISGFDSKLETPRKIKAELEKYKHEKTISLTVGKMLTGSTVEQWDSMLYFKDTASAQEYDQAIFRLQSPYIETRKGTSKDDIEIKVDKKPQTVLVDFDLDRVFKFEWARSIYFQSKADSGIDLFKTAFKKSQDVSPLLVLNKNKIQLVEEKRILDFISNYTKNNSILIEAQNLEFDENLIDNEAICNELQKFSNISLPSSVSTDAADDTADRTDLNMGSGNDDAGEAPQPSNSADKQKETPEEILKKNYANYCALILLFAFLTKEHVDSIKKVLLAIENDADSKRIAQNLRIDYNVLKLFDKSISAAAARNSLELAIYKINALNHDLNFEKTQEKKEELLSVAINKFNRVSDSEIATPEIFIDDLIGMIPRRISRNPEEIRILDFASLNGAIAKKIIEKYGENIRENIYAVPTSNFAYELTRKVYDILKIPSENILDFRSVDLVNNNEMLVSKIKELGISIVVGFPPLRKKTKGGAANDNGSDIYQYFFENLKQIDCIQLISMATKATWYTCLTPKKLTMFRDEIMSCRHLRAIHDYPDVRKYYQKSTIRGGVCLFLYDKKYNGKCLVSNIVDKPAIQSIDVERNLNKELQDYGAFIRWNEGISILEKVLKKQKEIKNGAFLYEKEPDAAGLKLMYNRNPFNFKMGKGKIIGIATFNKNKDEYPIVVHFAKDKKIYIKNLPNVKSAKKTFEYIPPNKRMKVLSEDKVLIAKASSGSDEIPRYVISNPISCGKNHITATTHYLIRGVKNKAEADNLASYMRTKFCRFMINLLRVTQNMVPETYRFAPRLDFSKKWTDEKLYSTFNISKSERKYINSIINERIAPNENDNDDDEDE